MRTIIIIGTTQLRRILADRSLFLWLFAMPLAIIGILGLSLQGLMSTDFTPATPFRVAIAQTGAYQDIQSTFEMLPELVTVHPVADGETARLEVLRRRVDAALIVPDGYPHESVTIVAVPGSVVAELLASIVHSTTVRIQDAQTQQVRVEHTSVPTVVDNAASNLPTWLQTSGFGYYAVAVTAMFAMFAAHSSMVTSAQDRAADTYARLRTLGVTPTSYMMAGALTSIAVAVGFLVIMALTTSLLFGARWGTIGGWTLLTFLGATAVAGLSLLIMAIVPKPDLVDGTGSAVFNVLAFLGGSMTPLHVLPKWFRTSFEWLPNRAMLDGYLKLAQGDDLSAITGELLNLLLAAAILFTVGGAAWRLRLRGEAY